jgi:hypothetical protein
VPRKTTSFCNSSADRGASELHKGRLKRSAPQHSLNKHRGDAGEGCFAKRAAQTAASPSRLNTAVRSTQETLKKSALQQKRKDWHFSSSLLETI